VVVDASALIDVVTAPPGATLRTTLARQPALHAPCLVDAEFVRALRHLEQRGRLTDREAMSGLHYLQALPVRRHGMETLAPRMWELRNNVTTYDAAYVALAERLALPLLTSDARLAAASGLRCQVLLT
jgi:predicted nucleic acid-binding protein